MYSPRRSYGSPPPELSNNPFIDHASNAHTRFPDIDAGESPANISGQFTSWLKPPGAGAASSTFAQGIPSAGYGYGAGGGYQQQQVAQQQTGWNPNPSAQVYQQNSGFVSPPVQAQPTGRPFQPSSTFGQQLQGAVNGAYGIPSPQQYTGYSSTSPQYGAGYQHQPQPQPQQYPPPPQVQQQTAQYLAEFDPYSQLSSMNQSSPTSTYGPGQGSSTYRPPHPRDYIRQHKAEMESWDSYTWKQALQSFEALKEAWLGRKREVEARGKAMGGAGLFGGAGYGYGSAYGGGQAQELTRLENLAKEASQNADSVAASTFQMQEAFSGYRQSSDLASKRRVRESINAALTSLPDWPLQQF